MGVSNDFPLQTSHATPFGLRGKPVLQPKGREATAKSGAYVGSVLHADAHGGPAGSSEGLSGI